MSWDIPIWGPQNQTQMLDFCKKTPVLRVTHFWDTSIIWFRQTAMIIFMCSSLLDGLSIWSSEFFNIWQDWWTFQQLQSCFLPDDMIFHFFTKPEGLVTSQLPMSMAESSRGFVTLTDFVWFCFSSVDDIHPPNADVGQWKIGFLYVFSVCL